MTNDKPTYVVNLFGGPGSGKSTTAAGLFYEMKKRGESVELVREYCKPWAWRGWPINKWDGLHFLGSELYAQSTLYGKVDTIITDAPLYIMAVYERMYNPGSKLLLHAVEDLANQQEQEGIYHVNCMVLREKAYVAAGRNETEEQAHKVDALCRQMVPYLYHVTSVAEVQAALSDTRSHHY